MTRVTATWVLVAIGVVVPLVGFLSLWVWDTYRPRGSVQNPLAGGKAIAIPTTAALRQAKRDYPPTPIPEWRALLLQPHAATWAVFVEEGERVSLRGNDGTEIVAVVVARAARATAGIVSYDYLGEVAGDPPYRLAFTHDKIWGVV